MNEQLQQELAKIASKTSDGIDFLSGELPDVASQLLTYKIISASFETILMILLIVAFALFVKKVNESIKKKGFFYESCGLANISLSGFMGFIIGGIAVIFCFIAVFVNIATILKIWIAPKIYLIEYAASLAK
jgi:hypothetical protein